MCARAFRLNVNIATLITALIPLSPLPTNAAEPAGSPPVTLETNRTAATRPFGPIPVEEAKQALTNLNTPAASKGTWRKMDVMDAMDMVETNISYRWEGPDTRRLVRSEQTHLATGGGKSAKLAPRTYVRVTNEEGSWALHDRVAILSPSPAPALAASPKNAGVSTNTAADRDDDLLDDPQIVTNMTVTGERIKEGGRVLLRVTSTIGDKAQHQLDILIDQKIKEAKKEAPLLLRPVLAAFPLKKMLLKVLPVRIDKFIDEDTHSLVLERGYNREGHLVMEEWAWAPWPDLPPESYQIPKDLKLLRPKTSDEAGRLEEKARKEDEKLRASR